MHLAFSGRARDLALVRETVARAKSGTGATIFLAGAGGVGKTRLAQIIADEAARAKFTVAAGRAYPVEAGVPYAVFADALQPLIRSLDADQLTVMVRGGVAELSSLFPFLGQSAGRPSAAFEDPAEYKTRLFWTFAEFLKSVAKRAPLLLSLDDVHWADSASLELLHFIARQSSDQPIVILCTYNSAERDGNPTLRSTERSLHSLGVAHTYTLEPLNAAETLHVVQQTFGMESAAAIAAFAARLYDWTKGNPFFLRETLQALVDSGKVREERGTWTGWQLEHFEVAPTIRDAIAARLDGLSASARQAADVAAVIGTRFTLPHLRAVNRASEEELVGALDELRRNGILAERSDGAVVEYDFAHPMFRQALYANLGIGRAKLLHGQVGDSLEAFYDAAALAHADELAYHFARADLAGRASKAVDYLATAGSSALQRSADREAVNYLTLALELLGYEGKAESNPRYLRLIADLARAKQRVGEFEEAVRLFGILLTDAAARGDQGAVAEAERRLGLANFWAGRHAEALQRFDAALVAASSAHNDALRARVLLARAASLQELGRADDARGDIEETRRIAESIGDTVLRARALRALLLLHTWTGPPDLARQYGRDAIALAEQTKTTDVLFLAHWSMAVLEGLTGHTAAMAEHIATAERIAVARNSPLMQLWCDELAIEHAFAVGDWSGGIARGEHAIALARSLRQNTLLPRLLVWTSLMLLGRGELDKARAYVDEAWELSGAARIGDGHVDVHTVVPAHIGRASYYMALQDFKAAIEVAEAGLEVADRSGYAFWAIHRVLPIIAEACCHVRDLDKAARVEERMRRDSERLGHKLGLAWAQACRAIIVWRAGDSATAVNLLAEAAQRLDTIPILPDAARLRRQLAGRLADTGDRTGALKELRHVHEVFVRLGAELELEKARGQFRELGAKPPAREVTEGAEGLTQRELAIARLVAHRKSNKAIGAALDISPRTVSTHLSNIFKKLEVTSRAELTEYLRAHGLLDV